MEENLSPSRRRAATMVAPAPRDFVVEEHISGSLRRIPLRPTTFSDLMAVMFHHRILLKSPFSGDFARLHPSLSGRHWNCVRGGFTEGLVPHSGRCGELPRARGLSLYASSLVRTGTHHSKVQAG